MLVLVELAHEQRAGVARGRRHDLGARLLDHVRRAVFGSGGGALPGTGAQQRYAHRLERPFHLALVAPTAVLKCPHDAQKHVRHVTVERKISFVRCRAHSVKRTTKLSTDTSSRALNSCFSLYLSEKTPDRHLLAKIGEVFAWVLQRPIDIPAEVCDALGEVLHVASRRCEGDQRRGGRVRLRRTRSRVCNKWSEVLNHNDLFH